MGEGKRELSKELGEIKGGERVQDPIKDESTSRVYFPCRGIATSINARFHLF